MSDFWQGAPDSEVHYWVDVNRGLCSCVGPLPEWAVIEGDDRPSMKITKVDLENRSITFGPSEE